METPQDINPKTLLATFRRVWSLNRLQTYKDLGIEGLAIAESQKATACDSGYEFRGA